MSCDWWIAEHVTSILISDWLSPTRPGSLKISHQASLNRLSSISSMSGLSSVEMSNLEDVVVTMESVCRHLVNRNYSLTVLSALAGLYSCLHQVQG